VPFPEVIFTLTLIMLQSIFSMGVFNWNAAAGEPVVTIYFWFYVGIAGGLTVLTVGTWLILTATKKTKNSDINDRGSIMSA
jgi:hypothetical protein